MKARPKKNWLGAIALFALLGGSLGIAILFENVEHNVRFGLGALLFLGLGVAALLGILGARHRTHYEDPNSPEPGIAWEVSGAMLVFSLAGVFAAKWANMTYDLNISGGLGFSLPLVGICVYWAWHFGRRRALARTRPPQEDCR